MGLGGAALDAQTRGVTYRIAPEPQPKIKPSEPCRQKTACDQDAYAEFYRTPFGCGKTVAGDRWRLTSILENRGTIVRFTLFASSTTDRHPSVRARLQARPRGNRVEA